MKLGAHITTNSFKCSGYGLATRKAFPHFGRNLRRRCWDKGYGIGEPMAYAPVVSVGGTILSKVVRLRRIVWSDTGGGCAMESSSRRGDTNPVARDGRPTSGGRRLERRGV